MERRVSNRYRLIEPLGEGGMGVVWRAYDELLDRTVAIKEVRYQGVGDAKRADLVRRTIREARAAGRLDHPSVIVVHDVVEEDGKPWIVMQLIRSRSLAQVVKEQGPLPVGQVAAIGGRVLDALRAAHATGVLHRDVKPENVLLADDGRVVLTDFGIASLEAEAGLTGTGMVVGTPAYMPPERLNGEPARPESDLWALGATLYAAVEGAPPFSRDSWAATVAAVLRDRPEPPSRAAALTPVIMGLLRREPGARMAAEEAARLLYEVATGGSGRPTPAPYGPATPIPYGQGTPIPYGQGTPIPYSPAPAAADARPAAGRARQATDEAPFPAHPTAGGPRAGHPTADEPPIRRRTVDEPPIRRRAAGEPRGGRRGVRERRRAGARWIAPSAAVAAVALLSLGGVLLYNQWTSPDPAASTGKTTGNSTGKTTGNSTGKTTGNSTGKTTGKRSAPATPAPTLPAGWRTFTSAAGRFSIALPKTWQAEKNPKRDRIAMTGPGTSGTLMVEWTVPEVAWVDPVKQWTSLEKEINAKGEFSGYTRIGITRIEYLGIEAADWEFTRMRGGQLIHVINRGFRTADGRHFALYWETPASRWARDKHYFETFAKTFKPL